MLGALLPALGGLASSLIGSIGANRGADIAQQERAEDRAAQLAMQEKEAALQREFAQSGVRWRVEDAKAAGIHPVFALGASGASYSPVGISPLGPSGAGSMIAESASNMGQDISRAVDGTRTALERTDAYSVASQSLTLDRMGLENELLRRQIAAATPPFPGSEYNMPGQSGSGTMKSPFGAPNMVVRNPGLAQDAQDNFGDLIENVYGVGNWLDSFADTFRKKYGSMAKDKYGPDADKVLDAARRAGLFMF